MRVTETSISYNNNNNNNNNKGITPFLGCNSLQENRVFFRFSFSDAISTASMIRQINKDTKHLKYVW
jgi:hypothetical protein